MASDAGIGGGGQGATGSPIFGRSVNPIPREYYPHILLLDPPPQFSSPSGITAMGMVISVSYFISYYFDNKDGSGSR